jgi:hypothetical protein
MDLVKCAVIEPIFKNYDSEYKYFDTRPIVIPVIDHPHNDKENGQYETHYHLDTAYIGEQNHLRNYRICTFIDLDDIRFGTNNVFKTIPLRKRNKQIVMSTNVELISKSKLKHNCIHKGKCPHRGMDLSQIKPNDKGEIICPLHSLKFDAITKKLIK